uniref:Hook microtubule tethering protein 2 n=1 Tax=Monodelphis domestica TaxID=13616 RepID=A0A5F8H249_MONDO
RKLEALTCPASLSSSCRLSRCPNRVLPPQDLSSGLAVAHILGHQVSDQHLPDVNLIGEFSDPAELGKLLQLVLSCAISCEKKQEHIQRIMTLEESVQHVVMTAIQELMSKDPVDPMTAETYGNFDSQSRRYYFLSEEPEEADQLRQRCHDLEQQLTLLVEEKQSLVQENRALKDRGAQLEGPGAAGLTSKRLLLLQSQLEQLQEENFRLENLKEDERLRCVELEKEVAELQQRNQALTSLAQEAQTLKDEMDELRQSSERASRLEATLSGCQRRLGELGELRRQVRLLEERNAGHAERTRQLEDELRRAGTLRAQLEGHRRQVDVQELQSQRQEEALKAEKWLFEYRTLEEKYEAVVKEKERLIEERDSLREAHEELCCVQVQQRGLSQADVQLQQMPSPVENLAAEILPAELRETVLRLQRENRRLCQQEAADRGRTEELQGQLEKANRARHGLETQHRLNQQQLAELRAQVEELQKALQEQGGKAEDVSGLGPGKLHEAHSELQRKREYIEELQPPADSNTRRIEELQRSLQKKEADMRAMEERYRRYMEKARTVIQTLEPKQRPPGPPPLEIQALRTQLQEKDLRIRHLETDFEKSRSQREQEEKLIISAWYNMGMALQQRAAGEDRQPGPAHAQSFLAQQRLATNTRRGPLARAQAGPARSGDKH